MPLANSFCGTGKRYRKTLTGFEEKARDVLMQHHFPGNVRELDHVIERAVLMTQGPQVRVTDLGLTSGMSDTPRLEDMSLEEVESFLIKKALSRFDGNARKAAEALGLSRSAFYRRCSSMACDVVAAPSLAAESSSVKLRGHSICRSDGGSYTVKVFKKTAAADHARGTHYVAHDRCGGAGGDWALVFFGSAITRRRCKDAHAADRGFGIGFILNAREHIVRPLQTMTNLLAALREGDYSIARAEKGRRRSREACAGNQRTRRDACACNAGAFEATGCSRTIMGKSMSLFSLRSRYVAAAREPRGRRIVRRANGQVCSAAAARTWGWKFAWTRTRMRR